MIKVKGLCKSFDNHQVLHNLDVEINKGEIIAVLGPSGSGKTTLLRCLNFLEKADDGELIFDNDLIDLKDVSKDKIHSIRNRTAFVFQNFNLFANKTVLENVTIGLTVARRMNKKKADEIGIEMLKKVNLTEKLHAYPDQLSGGQQQRVAIARALALSPEIIYFDEPTSALDPELINEVLNTIKNIANDDIAMVIVTHEMNFAKNVANRIIFMDEGNIVEDCSTEKFFTSAKNERIANFIKTIVSRGE